MLPSASVVHREGDGERLFHSRTPAALSERHPRGRGAGSAEGYHVQSRFERANLLPTVVLVLGIVARA